MEFWQSGDQARRLAAAELEDLPDMESTELCNGVSLLSGRGVDRESALLTLLLVREA